MSALESFARKCLYRNIFIFCGKASSDGDRNGGKERERVGASIETIDFPTEVLWTEWRAVLILSFFAAMLFHFFFFILMCCGAHAILNVLDILFLCHNKL